MNSNKIRKSFIDFFLEKGHTFVRSSPVIPIDDPTLLFTNAGMNQFKSIFLDQKKIDLNRVVNSQKCIRVSGKHNDLEEVGVDTFHHTFFEMLGNWSFNDYYKAESIKWAWELLTEVWGMDKNRLWATVYYEDNEAFDLWTKVTDIDPRRVIKCGKKDNFWEMGETGPCGPSSEIHYYIGDDLRLQSPKAVNNSNQYWELWNLVFIQSNRTAKGSLENLNAKHVDTGAGFERIVSVLQGKFNNYSTDLFMPIISEIENITGKTYAKNPVPFQVIADHIRMLSFSIADGGLPSNDGRGYVLRRILRRASRFGRMLDQNDPFMYSLVHTLGEVMGETFPEIVEKKSHIEKIISSEEASFGDTLDRGLLHFEKVIKGITGKTIPGIDAFKLYDTYGFPFDLTELIAREKGLNIDENGFAIEMKKQKKRARGSAKFKAEFTNLDWQIVSKGNDSKFRGYKDNSIECMIRRYAFDGDNILIVLDETPFYAESGGQVGDTGAIKGVGVNLKVEDVKNNDESIIHYCSGVIDKKIQGNVMCIFDNLRRQNIRKNHTATHLMHKALKQVLGDHVSQAGSLVHPDYLRFDISHYEKIQSIQLRDTEIIVNKEIQLNSKLNVSVKDFDEAKKQGAIAMFGEKYGNQVRVVKVSDFSNELCGGTHVDRTGDIGLFKISEESSLASGVRRLVAVTGPKAIEYIQRQASTIDSIKSQLNLGQDAISEKISQLIEQKKILEKEIKKSKIVKSQYNLESFIDEGQIINSHTVVIKKIKASSMDELKDYGSNLLNIFTSGIGVLGAVGEKSMAVIVVTKDLNVLGILAGELAKSIGALMGGGGGGKSQLATAGGKNEKSLDFALNEFFNHVKILLKDI